jgi:hypothetical protein
MSSTLSASIAFRRNSLAVEDSNKVKEDIIACYGSPGMPEKKTRKARPTMAPQRSGMVQPNRVTQNRRVSCVSGDEAIGYDGC